MTRNSIADLSSTSAGNTDILGQSTAGTALASTLDTIVQNTLAMLARFYDDLGGTGTVGGTADTITLASGSTFQALATGLIVAFKAGGSNTGATTIDVDGLGARKIRRQGDAALQAGDMVESGKYLLAFDEAYDGATGAWVLLNPSLVTVSPLGQHTIWVPAVGMTPSTTSGAAAGTAESSGNKVMTATLDFDAATEEFAQFMIQMPKSWNEGTLIAQFIWTHGATTTNFGVVWGIEAVGFGNSDALDSAWGTEVVTVDTGGTTGDVFISPESTAVTVGGSPGAEELVAFRITRVVGNGSDTMAVDAGLIGVKIHYTIDAATDD